MKSMWQRTYVNPGLMPDARFYIGIPVLGSNYINISNSKLNLKAFNSAFQSAGNDSFNLNVSKLADIFRKENYISAELNIDLLHFGFRILKNHFGYNATLRTTSRLSYPGDLFKLLLEGNGGENLGYNFNFDFGLDMMQFIEHGIWYGRKKNDKFSYGFKIKYLQGISIVWAEKSDLSFRTDPGDFSYTLSSDVKINTASSWVGLTDTAFKRGPSGYLNSLMSFKNSGFGLDIGAQYFITKKVSLSASIIDMGFIKWNSNVTNIVSRNPNSTATFSGADFSGFFKDSSDFENSLRDMADSIIKVIGVDTTYESFNRSLFTHFYLGGNFHITKNHHAGILFYGSYYFRKFHPALTLSWNSKFTKVLGVSVSYTMMNKTFNNLGLGLTLNGGPFQVHFITDNLINAIQISSARMLNIRFGMGFTIARKKEK